MQKPAPTNSSVRYLTVGAEHSGQRVDNYLLAQARSVPKSHIYRVIRTGQVRVNGGRVKPNHRLVESDTVRVPPLAQAERAQVTVPTNLIEKLENAVIHEDDELIVINKPPGLAVHAGSGVHFGVIDAFRQSRQLAASKLELIHRLDRGTSGCLMLGKGRPATLKYQQIFRQRAIAKHYLALVAGHWPDKLNYVDLPLKKNIERGGQRLVQVDTAGKEAISHFNVQRHLGQGSSAASLLKVRIETGRTHQIRVHAAANGHPIIGDDLYASNAILRRYRQLGLKRLYLHCAALELTAAIPLALRAPPDAAWQQTILGLPPDDRQK